MSGIETDMIMSRAELEDAARQMFASGGLRAPAGKGWENFISQGWSALALPEAGGGLGGGFAEQAVLYQELGRVLGAEPILPAWTVIEALASSDVKLGEMVLADLLQGGSQATLSLDYLALRDGRLRAVPNADCARWLLCWSETADQAKLIPLDREDIKLSARKTWDETRRLFDIEISAAAFDAGILLLDGDAATRLHNRTKAAQLIAIAADSVGGAHAILALTIEYLETRRQFERPLAMFQALKHRCADMKTAIEGSRALLWRAVGGRDLPDTSQLTSAGIVKAHATRTYTAVAEDCVQLHGGIGMTQEHPCHWFLKRALLNEMLGGSSEWEERCAIERLAAWPERSS